jgi:hypothetical protein
MEDVMKFRTATFLLAVAILLPSLASAQCQILRATYGAGRRTADVTSRVQAMAPGGQLNFRVSNSVFGDPAPNQKKTFQLTCGDWRGRSHTHHYLEGDVVAMAVVGPSYYPGGTWNRPNPSYQGLRIIEATYGHRHKVRDVTDRLNAMIRGPVLTFQVTNVAMGGDPALGLSKTLSVYYVVNGRKAHRNYPEGTNATIP